MTPASVPGHDRGVRILCLDGGGFRGVLTLKLLEAVEDALGYPLSSCFDLVAGTSTGGLISLALFNQYVPPVEMTKIYLDFGKDVFQKSLLSSTRLLFNGHKYDTEALEGLLAMVARGAALTDATSPKIFVTSATDGGPYLFRNYVAPPNSVSGSSTATVRQAGRATSAAPIYFPAEVVDGMRCFDGGLVANNPTMLALKEASLLWPGLPIDVLVSVGTGYFPRPTAALSSSSGPSVLGDLVSFLVHQATTTQQTHEEILRHQKDPFMFPKIKQYHRLNPTLDRSVPLDDVENHTILELFRIADSFIASAQFSEACESLKGLISSTL